MLFACLFILSSYFIVIPPTPVCFLMRKGVYLDGRRDMEERLQGVETEIRI